VGYWWDYTRAPKPIRVRTPICLKSANGKPVTKHEAQRQFDEMKLFKAETDSITPGSSVTVNEFWCVKFLPHIRMKLKDEGQEYGYLYKNHIFPALGNMRLRDVRRANIQDLIYAKQAAYLPDTIHHIKNVISGMFRLAKDLEYYRGDLPTERVQLPPMRRKEKRALDPDQARKLLAVLPEAVHDLCLFLIYTGLRIGEALGLRWRLVNLFPDWQLLDGKEVPPYSMVTGSKTEAGHRTVPLAEPAIRLLQEIKAKTKFAAPEDPVFATPSGRPMDAHNSAARVLKPMAKGVDLEWVSWHALRHTANTWGRMIGMSAMTRQRVFGWSADRMALHYDHASLEEMRRGMEGIAEMLGLGKEKAAVQ